MNLSGLPARTTPDREYYGALVDLIAEQNQILSRIADTVFAGFGGVVAKPESVPLAEPEPTPADDPVMVPLAIREPATTPPPASGPGSGRGPWGSYAATAGIPVDPLWNRDRIIAECRAAGTPT